jgi:hypothetical protein
VPDNSSGVIAEWREATMAKTLTVAPNLVPRVREATYGLLAVAAGAIAGAAHANEQPEPTSCTHLEHALAMLDRLGWTSGQDTKEAIELDPEHNQTLHAAIEAQVPLLAEWLHELDPDDASRPHRAEELRLIRQFVVRLTEERGGPQSALDAGAVQDRRKSQWR